MSGGHHVPIIPDTRPRDDAKAVEVELSPTPLTNGAGHAVDNDAEIAHLAKLPLLDYARERKAAAKRLGCPVKMLDAVVKTARGEAGVAGQGQPLEVPKTKPWEDEVNGAALLDSTMRAMREYVILSDAQAAAVALWSTYTHVYDAGDTTPKLIVKSPQKRSGKTRLAEVLMRTTSQPLLVSGISPAALLRVIERDHPTLLLDEMDATMKQDREMAEAMRGIINSGFNRSAAHFVKNVPLPAGGYEPRKFSTWCPQMFAGIGDLPETVRDRSIEIDMQRKLGTEKVKRLRERDGDDLRVVGRQAVRWGADNMDELRAARPNMPAGLNDRACDAWEPLFAIADLAGGDWPQRARRAALALSGDGVVEDGDAGIMVLGDIKLTFDEEATDHLFSEPLVATLGRMEERPWPEWKKGKPITTRQLAALLRQFKIKPSTIRTGANTAKGYRLAQFLDAFERYLPPDSSVTASQGAENLVIPGIFDPSQGGACYGSILPENTSNPAGCDGVTDRNGENPAPRGKDTPADIPQSSSMPETQNGTDDPHGGADEWMA